MTTNPTTKTPDKVQDAIANAPVAFGLRAQGHIPIVEEMLAKGERWASIGKAIGWDPLTAADFYQIDRLASVTPSPAPKDEDAEESVGEEDVVLLPPPDSYHTTVGELISANRSRGERMNELESERDDLRAQLAAVTAERDTLKAQVEKSLANATWNFDKLKPLMVGEYIETDAFGRQVMVCWTHIKDILRDALKHGGLMLPPQPKDQSAPEGEK